MDSSAAQVHREMLLQGLNQFYREGKLCDVTLVAGDRKFPCNRNILAATSSYFRAMFTSQVKESDQPTITLYDVIPEVMSDILDYMYSGVIHVTNENVQNLYITANLFDLLPLIDQCTDHMMSEISLANCLDLYNFASYHYNKRLKALCSTFVIDHFSDILETEEFLGIDVEFLEFLISKDDIDIDREETIYEAIIRWVEFDIDSRQHFIGRLFKHIRLHLMTDTYYVTNVATNPLLLSDTTSERIISHFNSSSVDINQPDTHIMKLKESHESEKMNVSREKRIGMFSRNLIVFSGGAYGPTERSFTAFDPDTNKNYYGIKPHPTFDFKYKLDYFQLVTVLKKYVYLLGGIFYENHHFEEAGPALDNMYLYDQKSTSWVPRRSMMTPRCAFSAAVDGKMIYVTGGKPTFPKGDTFDRVEAYDTENDIWEVLEPMPLKLYQHASTVHEGGLFIFGGQDVMGEMTDCVFRYDIKTGNWAVVTTHLRKPRVECSAITVLDKIYIVGGSHQHENALSVDIYDPTCNKWTFGSEFPDERKFTAITEIGDVIYVCGGVRLFGRPGRRSRHVETKDLYMYDVKSDKWTKLVKMVEYANTSICTGGLINYKYLKESEFVSTCPV